MPDTVTPLRSDETNNRVITVALTWTELLVAPA